MTTRLEPVPCYRARVLGTDGIIRSWGYFEGNPAQSAFAKQPDFYEIEVLVPPAPAPEGMREAIARCLFERGRTVHDFASWDDADTETREWLLGHADAILAIIAKGEGRE